jgi:sugar/nucleoside kinase (ribokinase family)
LLTEDLRGQLVVHTPDRVFAFSSDGKRKEHGSVKMPPELIQGAVGAGDAFAAGYLCGFTDGREAEECLRFGVCVAASSLLAPDSSSGVLPWNESLKLGETYGYH